MPRSAVVWGLQEFQAGEHKRTAKIDQAKKAEIAQLQQQHAAATKKRDQQIKALFDSKNVAQKRLEQVSLELEQVTTQCLAAGKEASIAGWIREIEDNSGDTVWKLCPVAFLMYEFLSLHMHVC
ncbi:MAG: hypothetical protein HC767_08245 [Akkermansiaceae bacterium]|nr:hypothetical protein [Akkermansiaceae bacterium]